MTRQPFKFDIEEAKKLTVENTIPAAKISSDDGNSVINAIADALDISSLTAFTLIVLICQKGGTSKKAQGDIYAIVDGKKLDLTTLRRIIQEKKLNITVRKWARTYAQEIFDFCCIHSIDGDLSKKIGRSHPNLSPEDKVWLSNFQIDNENCPERCRKMLVEHYETLFPNN